MIVTDHRRQNMTNGGITGPRVCTVILNWNRPTDTLECLDSLMPLIKRGRLAVVVCDNASSDDSLNEIQEWAEQNFELSSSSEFIRSNHCLGEVDWSFLLVDTGANRGFAGGNNVGIRLALERPCFKFVWLLNNDTLIEGNALDALESCARRDPRRGIFGSTIAEYSSKHIVQTAGGCRYNPLTTVMSCISAGQPLRRVLKSANRIDLDYVSGAAMFCRAEVLRNVGLLDERFFLYYEELDLTRRIRSTGNDVGWCKTSIVYHKGAISTGGRSAVHTEESWESNYYENLSTLLYTQKHHPFCLPVAALVRFFGKICALLYTRRFRLISALFQAYWDAVTGKRVATIKSDVKSRVVSVGAARKTIW